MKLSQLMTREVRTCQEQTPIPDVAKIMAGINVGAVPVCSGDQVVGMITDRDILLRSVAEGQDPLRATAGDCMTRAAVTASPDMDAHEAATLMADKQIRRLPVVENGRLCGIVSIGDLATVNIHVNEAGEALSEISRRSEPGAH